MPLSPNLLSNRPSEEDGKPFDVLADVLDSLRLTTLLYGQIELTAPWGLRFETAAAANLYVVARGGGQLALDGVDATVFLSAGDLVVLPRGGPHVLRDAPDSPVLALEESACRAHVGEIGRLGGGGTPTLIVAAAFRCGVTHQTRLLDDLPPIIHVPAHDRTQAWLPATVQLLLAESAARHPAGTIVMNRLVEVLFIQALRTQILNGDCARHGIRALADPPIGRALSLMHARPDEPWTNESLATAVALSRSGFAARFHRLVGQPPLEYLSELRMTRASALLRDKGLSLAEIAGRVGYANEASFHRAFKRWDGSGPGAFRRRLLAAEGS